MAKQATSADDLGDTEASAGVSESSPMFIALGVLLILVGLVAIGAPLATTIVVKIFAGWLLLVSGIAHVVHAFFARAWRAFFEDVLLGCLYTAVGIWLAFFPLAGLIGLTVLLAVTFVIDGVLKFQIGFRLRPSSGWLLMIASGVIAVAMGILLVLGLPSTAAWAIGLLIGVNILMSGIAFLGQGLSARA